LFRFVCLFLQYISAGEKNNGSEGCWKAGHMEKTCFHVWHLICAYLKFDMYFCEESVKFGRLNRHIFLENRAWNTFTPVGNRCSVILVWSYNFEAVQ
jgi:hypothetical protein